MLLVLFLISLVGGFLSGFLGLGGAVVFIPLMLTVPPLFGLDHLSAKTVSGLSMMQVLASSVSGILIHHKNNFVHKKALLYTGVPMGVLSLAGSYVSKYIDNRIVLYIFCFLIVSAFLMLILYHSKKIRQTADGAAPEHLSFKPVLPIIIGCLVGFMSGIVGAGGSFILIPLMVIVLKMTLKAAVGTSLGVVLIGAFFGAIGKIITLQIEWLYVIPVVIGSVAAGQLGARVSRIASPRIIKIFLLVVLAVSLAQVIFELIVSI